jgi:glucose-6-phosphate dehydrogenase assembly protein OpcA
MSIKTVEIEHQLKEIWQGFSQHQQDHAVTRAQVMNLLVFAAGEKEQEVTQALSDVANESPGRMIVLLHGSDAEMSSWVNALCHLSSGGRKQVCCEQIMIRGGDELPLQWSSAALPLFVPDLPRFLWWHDSLKENTKLLNILCESVDRLIIDSSQTDGFAIRALMKDKKDLLAISDLNWAGLTPWRTAIAGLYDHPQCRLCMESLSLIEIECETPFKECWQAQLLIGWIGSALQWKWGEGQNLINSKEAATRVMIQSSKSSEEQLQRVRLVSGRSEFVISQELHCPYLRCEIFVEGKNLGSQVIHLPQRSISAHLSRELSILSHDQVYERTITFLG